MIWIKILAACSALSLSGAACAKSTDQSEGTLHRLSPDQIVAIQDKQALRRHAGSDQSDADVQSGTNLLSDLPKRRTSGEVGFGIGTGGYRELFGTVIAPLGDTGVAALSFSQQRGGRDFRFRHW